MCCWAKTCKTNTEVNIINKYTYNYNKYNNKYFKTHASAINKETKRNKTNN